MKKLLFGVLVTAAILGAAAPSAQASPITFRTPLGPEASGATGAGTVEVVYDDAARTLSIDAQWSGLSGVTTVAHIHCCTALPGTGTVGVAVTPGTLPGFPVGVSAGSYLALLDLSLSSTYTSGFFTGSGGTTAGAEARLVTGMLSGSAYFNVHTNNFPGGEIRGFLAPVPDPGSTLLLLGIGLAGLSTWRKRLE